MSIRRWSKEQLLACNDPRADIGSITVRNEQLPEQENLQGYAAGPAESSESVVHHEPDEAGCPVSVMNQKRASRQSQSQVLTQVCRLSKLLERRYDHSFGANLL